MRTAVTDHHHDAKEVGRSFVEKRAPVFNQWLNSPERKPRFP